MNRTLTSILLALVICFGACAARANDFEFTLAGGATQVQVEGGGDLDAKWGPWIAPGFSLAPLQNTPQLRIGADVEFAWISADVDNDSVSGRADLFLITPEFRLSWRQPLGEHLYVEPGLGVGATIGALDFLGAQWGAGYSVRPLVRIAYTSENWSTGIELSYRFGHLDFGDADGNVNNFNAGLFVSFRL